MLAGAIDISEISTHCPAGLKEWLLTPKLISSIKLFGSRYKAYEDRLSVLNTSEWSKLTYKDIKLHLKQVMDNTELGKRDNAVVMHTGAAKREASRSRPADPETKEKPRGRSHHRGRSRSRSQGPPTNGPKAPEGHCFDFWKGKKCRIQEEGKECKFKHVRAPSQCDKCGSNAHSW